MRRVTLITVLVVSTLVALVAGCDDFILAEQVQASLSSSGALSVDPAVVVVQPEETVQFSVTGGVPEYSFAVQEPGGGTIDSSGLYHAPKHEAEYTVTVTDSTGETSSAAVHVFSRRILAISPTSAIVGIGDTYQFTASGGTAPYVFTVETDDDSEIGKIDRDSGLFTADNVNVGTGEVRLSDDTGRTVTARVYVQDGEKIMLIPGDIPIEQGRSTDLQIVGGEEPHTVFLVTDEHDLLYGDPASDVGSVPSDGTAYFAGNGIGMIRIRVTDNGSAADLDMIVVPRIPEEFVADGSYGSNREVRLSWTVNRPGTTRFRLERSTAGGPFEPIHEEPSTGAIPYEYIDEGRSPNTLYEYRVIAVTQEHNGDRILESPPTEPRATQSNL